MNLHFVSLELRAHDGSCDWIPQAVGVVHRLVTADSEAGKKYLKCWISEFQCHFTPSRVAQLLPTGDRNLIFRVNYWILNSIQSTLGFETLDKAAALGLATATPLTDPRQYINSNLGFSNLKI